MNTPIVEYKTLYQLRDELRAMTARAYAAEARIGKLAEALRQADNFWGGGDSIEALSKYRGAGWAEVVSAIRITLTNLPD